MRTLDYRTPDPPRPQPRTSLLARTVSVLGMALLFGASMFVGVGAIVRSDWPLAMLGGVLMFGALALGYVAFGPEERKGAPTEDGRV